METFDIEAIAELARKAAEPKVVTLPDGRLFLATPEGVKASEITDPHGLKIAAPNHIAQDVTVQTTNSLVDYLNRFKGPNTVLFADIMANAMKAVVDYHGPDKADHGDHVATMALPYSEEWKAWTAIDGKLMPQLDFARFIEENAVDIEAPSGAELLEVVRDLQAKRKVDFTKAVRTSSDNESFEYVDETTATTRNGAVEIPTKFKLRLPVYFGGRPTELFAFLRWRLEDTQLLLGVALHRREHVRQAIFKEIVDDVAHRTDLPAVFGKPC